MRPDAVFFQGQVWRLLTGCFLHSTFSYFHIVFNMLGLWFFGRYMEDVYGHKEFLAFYLMAGVVGNLAWGLTALWTHLPGLPWPTAVGASGAVMGVMVWCALTYPHKTLLIWFVPVPFWAFALIYIGSNLFTFLGGHDMWMDTRVAVAAHLGGAAFGLLYQKLDWRLTGGNWGGFFSRMRRPAKPRLRIYREEQTASVNSRPPESRIDEQLEAKADAVLDKLKRQGKESLTDEERDILQRASEQYRKKRSGQ
jgi:membrane associated rhomboid family serine protease